MDENLTDMQADIAQMEAELRSLDQVASAAKVLRNKANYLAGELDRFDKDYLTADQCWGIEPAVDIYLELGTV